MAILEIKARDVDRTNGNAQHMYWLYTNDAGKHDVYGIHNDK